MNIPPLSLDAAISGAVADAYASILCRAPDKSGQSYWEQRFTDEQRLASAFMSSFEGQRVTQVRFAYQQLLARDPLESDCQGLRSWVDSGLSLGEIGDRIAGSTEAAWVTQVRQVFTEVIGRDPIGWDNATLRRWVESGLPLDMIRQALVEQRPKVGVYYFTWYAPRANGWGNNTTTVAKDAPEPELGWYTSNDPAVLRRHIDDMEATGFDFAVVDVVAHSPESWSNARAFFNALWGRKLKAAVMLDGLYDADSNEKSAWVQKAMNEFIGNSNYHLFVGQPLVMLFSARIDFSVAGVDLRNVFWTNDYTPGANTYGQQGILQAEDWAFWSSTPQPITNGLVPVMPGYDDAAIGRSAPMHYPRDGGALYRDQWLHALRLKPSLITVYSWNEFFEKSAIEPTDHWGDLYLRWTACYIDHAHNGSIGECQPDVP